MGQICGLLRGLQRHIQDEVTSTQGPALEHLYAPHLTQINDSVYSLQCPEEKRPSVEIVLFHGLHLEGSHGAYITSWVSRSQSNPELWVKWILEDDKLEDARIYLISYDAHVRKTNEEGRMDMHNTSENLISDLIDSAKVGQDGCPVILVAHCLGGVLMKELCVQAEDRLGRCSQHTINPGVQNFLANVQGFFFYGSPHHGTELANISTSFKSPLFKDLTTLNEAAARRNEAFRKLRQKYGWRTFGIGETVPVNMGGFEGLVVEEASAREDMDDYYSQMNANHFNVCRPETRKSSIFCKLKDFVSDIVEKDKSRQGPTMKTSYFGLEPQVNEIRHKLVTKGIQRLGMVGMGGIGKTTLAKAVLNAILGSFDYTCFLMEVKKKTPDSLRDDIKGSLRFRGRPIGEAFKWSDLKNKRILIVLDDVTDESHVQVITEDEFLSSQNCTVIVTARDTGFLIPEDFECHSVRELDYENSEELFCKYAFKGAFEWAKPQYKSLVERFLQKCDGLPLAIEVAGRYLYKKSEEVWIESLGKLGSHPLRGNATDKLTSIVNMSYDDLAEIEQEMFVDVAHCFHGQRLSTVKQIWRICGCKGYESGWENLLDKGLVTKVPDPKWWEHPEGDSRFFIQMHELLRDLGLSKPCPDPASGSGSSQGKPPIHLHRWNSSRFIHWPEDMQALKIEECKYLVFLQRSVGQLERVEKLEISNCADLEAVPESVGLLSNLRDLSIQNCGKLSALPESLGDLTNLQRVTIWGCGRLKTLPESLWRLKGLEYLAIEGCDSLGALPDSLGQHPALKKLKISKCSNLQNIPRSIGDLESLQELMIQGCCNLKALPTSLGKLRVLEHLTIEECPRLETLPMSLGELPVLKHLEISNCSSLHTLPASIHLLPVLERLTLRGCHHLESLPKSLGQLQSLQYLTLEKCFSLRSLPESLGQLRDLRHLIIKGCQVLESLLWTFGVHEDLHVTIQECTSLRFLPFGWPGALEQQPGCDITIEGCPMIEDVQAQKDFVIRCQRASLDHLPMSIGNLRVLERLTIQGCSSLERLPENIGQLGALQHLTIQGCQSLEHLPQNIGQLGALQHLTIQQCPKLKELPRSIGDLLALECLTIQECHHLEILPNSLGQLQSLQDLRLAQCSSLRSLPESLGQLQSLQDLTLAQCSSLRSLPESLGQLQSLQDLTLKQCSSLRSLPQSLGLLRSLQHLTLEGCPDLLSLPDSLWQLRDLRHLIIKGCQVLESLLWTFGVHKDLHVTIQECTSLRFLPFGWPGALEQKPGCDITIDGCPMIEDVQAQKDFVIFCQRASLEHLPMPIGNLRVLERLTIQGCSNLEHLPENIGQLRALQHLTIERCVNLKHLPENIGQLGALQHLTIEFCSSLEYLPENIGQLGALQHLTIRWCKNLKHLPENIGQLGALQHLTIYWCKNLKHLPENIGQLGALQHLTIQGCYSLEHLPQNIGQLGALQHLTIQQCPSLEHLPENIGQLGALQHLTIYWCESLKHLPENIGQLRALQHLTIKECESLEHLPENIGQLGALQHLTIKWCKNLKQLPKNIGQLGALQHCTIDGCESLEHLPENIWRLRALQYLTYRIICFLRRLWFIIVERLNL